jgi:chemotaxis protein methyltransferase CheR
MNAADLEDLEVDLLLEALDRRYGYDFRRYSQASLRRRLLGFVQRSGLRHVAQLIPAALHEPGFLDQLVNSISVPVTEPFRDPAGLAAIVTQVFPWLQSHPFSKIWLAGCASGEEVHSLAILLDEAGLLERVQLYATDINTATLAAARQAIYPLEAVKRAEENYRRAGGRGRLADYYVAQYGYARMLGRLQANMIFSQHNLATDAAFGEMQCIVCRNVLIYFNRDLQARVVNLFLSSLARRGFLALGAKETLEGLDVAQYFEVIDRNARLFRAL